MARCGLLQGERLQRRRLYSCRCRFPHGDSRERSRGRRSSRDSRPRLVSAADEGGHRRLDDENDYVRLEVECALRLGKVVIPVLVRGGAMPRPSELPETLSQVAFRHAVSVRPDPDFHRDMDRLIQAIKARKAERYRTSPPHRAETRRWALFALALLGIVISAVVIGSFFFGRRGQEPNRHPLKVPEPSKQAINESPVSKTNVLPFPQAPSKATRDRYQKPQEHQHLRILGSQRGAPPLPSAQGPPAAPVPSMEEAPPAPPAPAPRSGFFGTFGQERDHYAAAEPASARKTTPRSDAESAEGVPPPPLIPISTHHRSS